MPVFLFSLFLPAGSQILMVRFREKREVNAKVRAAERETITVP